MSVFLESKARIFKALGHTSRLAIVEALQGGELCVCEIQPIVGKDISTVSKHLSLLKEAGIVKDEKRGTNVYYRLNMECVAGFLNCVEEHISNRMQENAREIAAESLKKL